MKKKWLWISVFCVGTMFFGGARPAAAFDDAIVAIVNDELITALDLKNFVKSSFLSLLGRGLLKEEMRQAKMDMEINALPRLIEDKLFLSKANELEVEVDQRIIEQRIGNIKKQYPSEKAFLDALVQSGATLGDLRQRFEDQMKIKMLVDNVLKARVEIGPGEITAFYQNHIEQFRKPLKMNVASIFISYGEDKDTARKRMEEIVALLNADEDFSEVSEKHSDAPSIGEVEQGQLQPEIEDEILILEEGEISVPIETETGFYIFQLIEKSEAEIAELEEVEAKIKDILHKQKYQKEYTKFLDELKEDAYIEIKK